MRRERWVARRSVGRWCVVSGAPWRTKRVVRRGTASVNVRRKERMDDCWWGVNEAPVE